MPDFTPAEYAAIVAVGIPIATVIVFCNCLKRRKDAQGNWTWKQRVACQQKRCLFNRPRSFEAHLQRQLEKAKQTNAMNITTNNVLMTQNSSYVVHPQMAVQT